MAKTKYEDDVKAALEKSNNFAVHVSGTTFYFGDTKVKITVYHGKYYKLQTKQRLYPDFYKDWKDLIHLLMTRFSRDEVKVKKIGDWFQITSKEFDLKGRGYAGLGLECTHFCTKAKDFHKIIVALAVAGIGTPSGSGIGTIDL